jgi:hypothetical protein
MADVKDSEQWTPELLAKIIAAGETETVEFKRQWYDLTKNEEKAKFAKDVLALANRATAARPALLILGVEDDGKVCGLTSPDTTPGYESISQMLTAYTLPPVKLKLQRLVLGGKPVDLLEVYWQPAHPHHAIREVPPHLMRDQIYVRRGRTIGVATFPEVEAMIRQKDAILGSPISSEPLEVGFVDKGDWSGRPLIFRVRNISDEPVSGIDSMLDISLRSFPGVVARPRQLVGAVLQPRESREIEVKWRELSLSIGEDRFDPGSKIKHRYIDAILHVHYRDKTGYIQSIERRLAFSD